MSCRSVHCLALFLLCVLPGLAMASSVPQSVPAAVSDLLLNADWSYSEDAGKGPEGLEQAAFAPVDLPHSWNSLDATDAEPGYRRDASWYRKQLEFAAGASGFRHILYFEGANMRAEVYVNGEHAGGHVGGYLGFEIEITDLLDFQGVNDILVRVDNSVDRSLIPSQKADFVMFGGLTRDVYLQVRPGVHIDAVQIDTPAVSLDEAQVSSMVFISGRDEAEGD